MKCRLNTLCVLSLSKVNQKIRLQPISFEIIMISNNFWLLVLGYTRLFRLLLDVHMHYVSVYIMIIFCHYDTLYADRSHQQLWVQIAIFALLPQNAIISTCCKLTQIENNPINNFEGYIWQLQIRVLSIWIVNVFWWMIIDGCSMNWLVVRNFWRRRLCFVVWIYCLEYK